mgnify:CR=1 FL=1
MTCATNKLQINDEWRDVLIVGNDSPVTFANPGCIADGGVLYFTDGTIFKSEQQDGKYYYWFIIERQEVRTVDQEARDQASANALTLLDLDYRVTLTENGVKESDLE